MILLAAPVIAVVALAIHHRMTHRPQLTDWYTFHPSGGVPELEHVIQSATSAAGHMKQGAVAVVATRRAEGVVVYVGVDARSSRAGVNALAKASNAAVEPSDPPPIGAGVAVCGAVDTANAWSGGTSNKGDVSHAAKQIADSLTERGEWVGVVARRQNPRELKAIKSWYSHLDDGPSADNHPCCSKNALVAQVWAASDDKASASSHVETLTGALAGFDIALKPRRPGVGSLRPVSMAAAVSAAAAAWLLTADAVAATAAGLAFAIVAAATWLRPEWYGNRRRLESLRAGLPKALAPMPLRHRGFRKVKHNDDGSVRRAERNDYPFGDHRVPFGAQHLAFLAAPHGGAASGANIASQREPSPGLTIADGGSLVGVVELPGPHRQPLDILIQNTAPRTIAAIGEAGAGKSEFLRSVFAADCARKFAGERRGMIVLESQGGAEIGRWVDVAERHGVGESVVVVDINDPSTPRIDMFAGEGTPQMRARRFLDLFFTSDETGGDGGVSLTPAMNALLAVAIAMPHAVAESVDVRAGSVIWYASVLAGGEAGGDDTATRLWAAFVAYARGCEVDAGVDESVALTARALQRTAAGDSAIRLAPYFAKKEAARARDFEPVVRRLANLATIDSWFDPEREALSWATLIDEHRVVILNHGEPASRDVPALDMAWGSRLSEMLLSGIQTAIKSTCSGWQDEGRRTGVFADELSIVAKASPEVPEWMRQQARKFGVDPSFATQAAHQLEDTLLKTLLGFTSMLWLRLGAEPSLLELARTHLRVDRGTWDDVVDSIPTYHAIMLSAVDGVRQPGVMVKLLQAAEMDAAELRRRCGINVGR